MRNTMDDDISREINVIISTVPRYAENKETGKREKLTDLEVIRWLYMKLGELFCYDYRIARNIGVAKRPFKYDEENNLFLYVNKYETCIQISRILTLAINHLGLNARAKVVERKVPNMRGAYIGNSGPEHEAVEVEIFGEEPLKLMLDLTLDLYTIQSGCRTMEFGYTTDATGSYDIISHPETDKIDEKLRLIKGTRYTDDTIRLFKSEVDKKYSSEKYRDVSKDRILKMKLEEIAPTFNFSFTGSHEGKRFIIKVLTETLADSELRTLKEYNLSFKSPDSLDILTCFIFHRATGLMCYLYDNKLGLIETTPEDILRLFDRGFVTKSETLIPLLKENVQGDDEKDFQR